MRRGRTHVSESAPPWVLLPPRHPRCRWHSSPSLPLSFTPYPIIRIGVTVGIACSVGVEREHGFLRASGHTQTAGRSHPPILALVARLHDASGATKSVQHLTGWGAVYRGASLAAGAAISRVRSQVDFTTVAVGPIGIILVAVSPT